MTTGNPLFSSRKHTVPLHLPRSKNQLKTPNLQTKQTHQHPPTKTNKQPNKTPTTKQQQPQKKGKEPQNKTGKPERRWRKVWKLLMLWCCVLLMLNPSSGHRIPKCPLAWELPTCHVFTHTTSQHFWAGKSQIGFYIPPPSSQVYEWSSLIRVFSWFCYFTVW